MKQDASRRQTWSVSTYDEHARFVSDLAGGVLDWLAPKAGERILDLALRLGRPIRIYGVVPANATSAETSWKPVATACLPVRRTGPGMADWNSVSVDVSGIPR